MTFDQQGGAGGTAYTIAEYNNVPLITPPTRTGYTFGGYYTAKNGGGTQYYTASGMSARNWDVEDGTITLYAKWTANTYTVTYNANGGSVSSTSKTVTYDSTYGTLPTPTRTGYTFAGWFTAASGGTQITASTKVTTAANHTLYAHWTANTYTVTFNANGGSGSMAGLAMTYGTAKNLTANAFTRAGYTFSGWATSASGAKVYDNSQSASNLTATANGTVNLYAVWTANSCRVRYNNKASHYNRFIFPNGVTTKTIAGVTATFDLATDTITLNGTLAQSTSLVVFPLDGVRADWPNILITIEVLSGSATNPSVIFDVQSTEATSGAFLDPRVHSDFYDVTGTVITRRLLTVPSNQLASARYLNMWLYKKDSTSFSNLKCRVYIETDGITATSPFSSSALYSPAGRHATYDAAMPAFHNPARPGYTFGGYWTGESGNGVQYYNADGSSARNWNRTVTEQTLYAKWTAKTYTVTYNANGGSVTTASKTVTYDSPYGTLPTPTRANYTFAGWFTAASGGTQITASTKVTTAANHTLYAHWNGVAYTVKFENGYGGTYHSASTAYGSTISIAGKTRAYYNFAGWQISGNVNTSTAKYGLSSGTVTSSIPDNKKIVCTSSNTVYFKDLCTTSNGTVTITALWTRKVNRITLTENTGTVSLRVDRSEHDSVNIAAGKSATFDVYANEKVSVHAAYTNVEYTGEMKILRRLNGLSIADANFNSSSGIRMAMWLWTFGDTEASESWSFTYVTVKALPNSVGAFTASAGLISFDPDHSTDVNKIRITAATSQQLNFTRWDISGVSGVTGAAETASPIALDLGRVADGAVVTATANYAKKRLSVGTAFESASVSVGNANWISVVNSNGTEISTIDYGDTAKWRIDIPEESGLGFEGWFDSDDNLKSTDVEYSVVISEPVTYYARLNAEVRLSVSASIPGNAIALLSLNDTTSTKISNSIRVGLGCSFSFGIDILKSDPNDDTEGVFCGWYLASDNEFTNVLDYAQHESRVLSANMLNDNKIFNIVARVMDSFETFHIAVYNRENGAVMDFGAVAVSGVSLKSITQAEYESATGTSAGAHGSFYEIYGVQKITLSAQQVGGLGFLRFQRAFNAGVETVLTKDSVLNTVVNRNCVYYADWGDISTVNITASLRSADGIGEGTVDVGSEAIARSIDSVSAIGRFEVGTAATIIAKPLNGWRFVGWFADSGFNTPIVRRIWTLPNHDMTIYARWSYRLSHNTGSGGGGTGQGGNENVERKQVTITIKHSEDGADQIVTGYAGDKVEYTLPNRSTPSVKYTFHGFYRDADFTERATEFEETDPWWTFIAPANAVTYYAKFVRESIAIYKWEGSRELKRLRWKSKVYELSKPANLTSVRLDARGYDGAVFRCESFSAPDGEPRPSGTVELSGSAAIQGQSMRRLPMRRPERYFQITVENGAEIDTVTVGTSGEGLAQ